MTTNHTPTPWSVHPFQSVERAEQYNVALGHPLSNEPGAFQIFTDDGRGNGLPLPESEREANAAHIVRCVNSHDAMVKVLKMLDRWPIEYRQDGMHSIFEEARAALRAATGE